jgi:hypothetical protein
MITDHRQNATQASDAGVTAERAAVVGDCLAALRRTAMREPSTHTGSDGICALCDQPWPCPRVRMADLALAGW